MRFVITSIAPDDDEQIGASEEPAVVCNTIAEVEAYIRKDELHNIEFDISCAAASDDTAYLYENRDKAEQITVTLNGNAPVTIPSVWGGPANEGGYDWIILPIAA